MACSMYMAIEISKKIAERNVEIDRLEKEILEKYGIDLKKEWGKLR